MNKVWGNLDIIYFVVDPNMLTRVSTEQIKTLPFLESAIVEGSWKLSFVKTNKKLPHISGASPGVVSCGATLWSQSEH
jgi:hypothetical protein